MPLPSSSAPLLVARIAVVAIAAMSGCIIAAGGGDSNACGSQLSHSHFGAGDMCYCDAGYTWQHPDDETDFDCEQIPGKGSGAGSCSEPYSTHIGGYCYCDYGYVWCAPDNANDYTCCMDDAQDTAGGGTGVETGEATAGTGDTGAPAEPDPADCTTQTEGANFCSNTEEMTPEGSRYWKCTGGAWVEMPDAGTENCTYDGYAFSYGCVDTGTAVQFVCGNGPGTACERDTSTCKDTDQIQYCLYGKLTEDSCNRICMEDGDDMGVTYDAGCCSAASNDCLCFDMGDPGCM